MNNSLFKTVALADMLISELHRKSSQAEEFLELFTLQFIVEQLNQEQLQTFEKKLHTNKEEDMNVWLRKVIPEFDKKYVEKLQNYLLNTHTQ